MGRVRDSAPDDQADVIQIALRHDGAMPTGVATGADGSTRDFTGWVGLMSAVDALAAVGEDKLTEEE